MQAIIAVTPGEPAGIGPDILIDLALQSLPARLLCVADPELMRERACQLGRAITIKTLDTIDTLAEHRRGVLQVFPVKLAEPVQAGVLNQNNAAYVLSCLSSAIDLIQQGKAHALVTGPVHKGIINDAGIAFTGHTEYLAELTAAYPVMMLATDSLRVALATTHLPLQDVSQAITRDSLRKVLNILHHDLQKQFGISQPRILVCGLNPHAGEGGHLGHEEINIIEPVLAQLRAQGMQLIGPLPADTLFTPKYLQQADAVLAMYHDQGLPVLKYSGFGHAINITLGLPVIRTSVDHGTALELAGTGQASSTSLQAAFLLAAELANKKYGFA
ncbi:MAG: 4-hydroxythreonine-4-phosphate dehydrogenase PdxA [Gammaproteobacteria bacterium]|nr:MAG: 4-hydroxythreonine-4-phosphate dehydrogenase PdxA [Gammaproteobacteria bacterium]